VPTDRQPLDTVTGPITSCYVHHRVLAQADVASDHPVRQALAVQVEHPLCLLVGWALSCLSPKLLSIGLGGGQTRFTRSRIWSRSNSAMPAMMVRINLPLDGLRSKLSPLRASTLTMDAAERSLRERWPELSAQEASAEVRR
jgi:hypothetical protein